MKSTYCVLNKTKETFLGLDVACASTALGRLRGLLGRLRISSGEGLWVVPSRGIHTLGLLFPVDIVYLDADYRVVHLIEHLNPFRFAPVRWNCASVLELPAHTIYASQTCLGDQLLISTAEEIERELKKVDPASAVDPTGKATAK